MPQLQCPYCSATTAFAITPPSQCCHCHCHHVWRPQWSQQRRTERKRRERWRWWCWCINGLLGANKRKGKLLIWLGFIELLKDLAWSGIELFMPRQLPSHPGRSSYLFLCCNLFGLVQEEIEPWQWIIYGRPPGGGGTLLVPLSTDHANLVITGRLMVCAWMMVGIPSRNFAPIIWIHKKGQSQQ